MESRRILKELYVGIGAHVVIFLIIGAFFMRPYWMYAIALLVGGGVAAFLIYHIYDCLDQALDMTEKGARSFVSLRSLLRLATRAALMIVGIMIHWSCFVGVTVGLLSPKVAAYLNPCIHRCFNRFEGVDDTLDIEEK